MSRNRCEYNIVVKNCPEGGILVAHGGAIYGLFAFRTHGRARLLSEIGKPPASGGSPMSLLQEGGRPDRPPASSRSGIGLSVFALWACVQCLDGHAVSKDPPASFRDF